MELFRIETLPFPNGWLAIGFQVFIYSDGHEYNSSEITATSQDLTPDGAVVGEASDKWPNVYGNGPKTHLILCIQVASRCCFCTRLQPRSRCANFAFFFGIVKGRFTTHGPARIPLPVFQGEGWHLGHWVGLDSWLMSFGGIDLGTRGLVRISKGLRGPGALMWNFWFRKGGSVVSKMFGEQNIAYSWQDDPSLIIFQTGWNHQPAGWFQIFLFSPRNLGEMDLNLTSIFFQMGLKPTTN